MATEAQNQLIGALDDAVEHLHWEFDAENYQRVSTCGFARIAGISGNSSFYRSLLSLAESGNRHVERRGQGGINIDVGGIEMLVREDYRGGFSLSITNPQYLLHGPSYQRLDFRERIHQLILERLQYEWGYLEDARIRSRVD